MAARAKELGDTGESGPETLGKAARDAGRPRGARRGLARCAAARGGSRARLARRTRSCRRGSPRSGDRTATRCPPRRSHSDSGTASAIRRSKEAEFREPIRREQPLKAGEFVLGYRDEMGGIQMPQPEVLGRNGTYVVFRKLHQRVAAFRRYLKANATSPDGRGVAGGQDDGPLAQRRAPGALPAPRRSGTGRRPATQQRFPLSRKTTRQDSRPPAARTSGGRTRATRLSRAWPGFTE